MSEADHPAPLRVRLLGDFRVDGVELDALRSRKARTLVKRLAIERGASVSVGGLTEAIWPAAAPARPERDLHVLVSRARAVVGAQRIARRDGGYVLVADWWDVEELLALGQEADRRSAADDLTGARAAAEGALELVRGPLLADEPDAEWASEARAAVAAAISGIRRVAATTALAMGQPGAAAAHAAEVLRADPYAEDALRTLMRAHAAAGRPGSALAEFARLRERLADELGVDPAPATLAVHAQILTGRVAAIPARTLAPDPSALVGRAAELRTLDAELQAAATGTRLVLVTGEPGIGKTTLLDRWAAAAVGRGVVVLRGRTAEDELALQPVLDALASRLAGPVLDDDAAAGLPGPRATADALNLRVFAQLDAAVAAVCGSAGTALVIDDGDLADPVTWAWLAHARRRHRLPLLIVVAVRDPRTATADPDALLRLAPLTVAEAGLLVGARRAAELVARSGGNPLLLVELARADGPPDEVPGSLRDAVLARLRRTGAAEATLQAAAVLGARVDLDLLASVLRSSPVRVLEHLDLGVRQSFLTEHEGGIAFRHDLVRRAVAAGVGPVRRAWLHRSAAQVLRTRPDANPLDLARHAREGGNGALAADAFAAAADRARARLDLPGAERLLDAAIDQRDCAALRLRRSHVRMSRADLTGAEADAEAALAAGDATGEALELRAWVARNRHDLAGAVRLGRAAVAAATDPVVRGSALIAVAFGHRGMGDLRTADAVLAEAAGAPAELGLSAWIGVLRVHQGRPSDALAALEPMLGADARRGVQGFWVEHTLQMTAHAYGLLGRSADALRVLDRLEAELDRRGTAVRYAGVQHTYRSWILRNLGAPDAAESALAGLAGAGNQEIRAQCHLDVADCLLRSGDLDGSAARLAVAEVESGTRWFHNKWRFDQRRSLLQARLHLAGGDATGAREAVEPLVAAAEGRGDARYAVLARLVRAAADARLGRPADAARLAADLDRLGEVGALEGWWLAADVADATGSGHARAVAERLAGHVAAEAAERADRFCAVAAARLR
ncbi:BTAD domain-containing putative transcriptional regulator [Pseudonocardia thermophila]|uniref:BTAD domain-containing putative transcriptional regulator n=1 Tax=Pseudonocardia thermophila TaxID=1848 RepID=UPI00248F1040|nr:BTAD domain-containing putative transcriptional regulator [Pseudonocardia thermophila]